MKRKDERKLAQTSFYATPITKREIKSKVHNENENNFPTMIDAFRAFLWIYSKPPNFPRQELIKSHVETVYDGRLGY